MAEFQNRLDPYPLVPIGFSVLDAQQIAVDGDLRVAETDVKNFVGNLEIVFVRISFGPLLKLHIAPPVCSSTH